MPKRGSERQLTKDDYEDQGDDRDSGRIRHGIDRASTDQLRTRKIVKTNFTPPPATLPSEPSKNPFASLSLPTPNVTKISFASTTFASQPSATTFSLSKPSTAESRDLNSVFIDYILKALQSDPARDVSNAAIDYDRYALAIQRKHTESPLVKEKSATKKISFGAAAMPPSTNKTDDASTSKASPAFSFGAPKAAAPATPAAPAPAFTFGKASSNSVTPAPIAAVPATDDNTPSAGDQEESSSTTPMLSSHDSDYDSIYRVEPVVQYTLVDDALEKFKGRLSFNIEKSKTGASYIGTFRTGFNPSLTFGISKGMEFTVIAREGKKGVVKTLRFMTMPAETNESTTLELKVGDDKWQGLFENLGKCGAVIKGE